MAKRVDTKRAVLKISLLYTILQFHTVPQFHTAPHSPVMIMLAKDRNLYRGFVAGSYNLVHTQTVFMYLHTVFIHSALLFALYCWSTNSWASFDRWGSPLLSDTIINIFQINLSKTGTKVFEASISIEASFSVPVQIHRLVKKSNKMEMIVKGIIYDALSKAKDRGRVFPA